MPVKATTTRGPPVGWWDYRLVELTIDEFLILIFNV